MQHITQKVPPIERIPLPAPLQSPRAPPPHQPHRRLLQRHLHQTRRHSRRLRPGRVANAKREAVGATDESGG